MHYWSPLARVSTSPKVLNAGRSVRHSCLFATISNICALLFLMCEKLHFLYHATYKIITLYIYFSLNDNALSLFIAQMNLLDPSVIGLKNRVEQTKVSTQSLWQTCISHGNYIIHFRTYNIHEQCISFRLNEKLK